MNNLIRIFLLVLLSATLSIAQESNDTLNIPENSILKNFHPFSTPRTNYRPGTVYRIDKNKREYFVEDVKAIKDFKSEEGTITGRIFLTKEEMLTVLNLEVDQSFVTTEVEIKEAVREFNEQTNIDNIMWEKEKAENIIVDEGSSYYIIRETVLTKEVSFRFSEEVYSSLITGKAGLKKTVPRGEEVIDFPYYITKKFNESRRIFYLEQEIGVEPYN